MAELDIPDQVYNWLVSYFSAHSHCTRYGGESSSLLEISAGTIQGSGIGPASYVVNSSDLAALTPGNRKRLQAVIRRGIRSGLCEQHHKTVEELVEEADDKLFTNVT